MANNFKVWVDSPGSVIMNAEDFASDSQRTNGFTAGQAASALRVNSALRQANLVAAALMGLVDDNNLDLKSSVSDVQNGIASYLSGITVNNVSTNINGKAISTIFESNGTTVKNATNATNATNANITTNTEAANTISFQIGNGTAYNKTITPLNSYDETKGTIEARLNSAIHYNLVWSGNVPTDSSSYINVKLSYSKKYCICFDNPYYDSILYNIFLYYDNAKWRVQSQLYPDPFYTASVSGTTAFVRGFMAQWEENSDGYIVPSLMKQISWSINENTSNIFSIFGDMPTQRIRKIYEIIIP